MSRAIVVAASAALLLTPSVASAADSLSTSDRLDDRRCVTSGPRAYAVGTEAGRFPAMGFHTRGEMGGVWTPPIKLIDGIWFGIGGKWIGPATKFTSGYGHVKMALPGRGGLTVERTDFVPGEARGVLVGLRLKANGPRTVNLKVDAHSELMGIYPWGETTPSQSQFNLPDTSAYSRDALIFTEKGTPPVPNAQPHDWAAAVGSKRETVGWSTGPNHRGPQDPAVICPGTGPSQPERCDDSSFGKGRGGQLRYRIKLPKSGRTQSGSAWRARSPARPARAPSWRGSSTGRAPRCAPGSPSARRCRSARASISPATRCWRAGSTGASRTSPTPSRGRATSRSARPTRARTTRRQRASSRRRASSAASPTIRGCSRPTASSPRSPPLPWASSSRSSSTCARSSRRR